MFVIAYLTPRLLPYPCPFLVTAAAAAAGNDADSLAKRGICVGDVVKVMDDGFWVEGVVVNVIDKDNLLIGM